MSIDDRAISVPDTDDETLVNAAAGGEEAVGRGRTAGGDTAITRVLGILDLFTPETPLWTVDLLVERLHLARATIYRYVRALCDAALTPAAVLAAEVAEPFPPMADQLGDLERLDAEPLRP